MVLFWLIAILQGLRHIFYPAIWGLATARTQTWNLQHTENYALPRNSLKWVVRSNFTLSKYPEDITIISFIKNINSKSVWCIVLLASVLTVLQSIMVRKNNKDILLPGTAVTPLGKMFGNLSSTLTVPPLLKFNSTLERCDLIYSIGYEQMSGLIGIQCCNFGIDNLPLSCFD